MRRRAAYAFRINTTGDMYGRVTGVLRVRKERCNLLI